MSTFSVEVVKIIDIKSHPNADRLDLVTVKGWQVVTQKGLYNIGDLVIYCPIDAVLPIDLSDRMDVTKYLSKQRVKTTRLRGEYSQGLLIPLTMLDSFHINPSAHLDMAEEGLDVSNILGIIKYEAPIPVHMAGLVESPYSDFHKYTDIENIKNFPDVLQEGEEVIITEKIHGTNFRIGQFDNKIIVGSRTQQLKNNEDNKDNLYVKIANKIKFGDFDKHILFGEIYGKGVQKLPYDSTKEPSLRLFDISINGEYLNYMDFENFCKNNDLQIAPVLYIGPWKKDLIKLADSPSTLANHIKEGIVIRPIKERTDRKLGRVILKHISEAYLMKDYGDLH